MSNKEENKTTAQHIVEGAVIICFFIIVGIGFKYVIENENTKECNRKGGQIRLVDGTEQCIVPEPHTFNKADK